MRKIGFIGLGAMGLPIAKNLLNAGHELYVGYNSNRKPAEEIEALGGTICEKFSEIGEKADVIFLVVPNDAQVESSIFGKDGVAEGLSAGKIIIDMSTIDLFKSREFAARLNEIGCEFIDAPISGRPEGAQNGTLAIMVGAKKETFDAVYDLFDILGKNIVHCGDNGVGLAAKMANNLIASSTIVAISEAFTLAIKAGISPDTLFEVLKGATANGAILNSKVPAYLNDNYAPGFQLKLMCKDLGIITSVAKKLGTPTLAASLVEQVYNMCKEEHGDKDSGAVSLFYQKQADVSFKSTK